MSNVLAALDTLKVTDVRDVNLDILVILIAPVFPVNVMDMVKMPSVILVWHFYYYIYVYVYILFINGFISSSNHLLVMIEMLYNMFIVDVITAVSFRLLLYLL